MMKGRNRSIFVRILFFTLVFVFFAGRGALYAATITVNSSDDTTIADDKKCTLPEAIIAANTDTASGDTTQFPEECAAGIATDVIQFAVGSGLQTITPGSALPNITSNLTIDGTTQPGFSGTPIIELDGASAMGATGLNVTTADVVVVIRGLVIHSFETGIALGAGTSLAQIEGNFIGTNPAGTMAMPNTIGIIVNAMGHVIGGTDPGAGNLISGNDEAGIELRFGPNNRIEGNLIGTDVTGTLDLGNGGSGILIVPGGTQNTIGGTVPGAGNLISGNGECGLSFVGGSENHVEGNLIGTDITGTSAIPNDGCGVELIGDASLTFSNLIGGNTPAHRNVISGNGGNGINLMGNANDENTQFNTIQGNFIGLDISGNALPNTGAGVHLEGVVFNNLIGGDAANGEGNVIAFNTGDGVELLNNDDNVFNRILGNSIHSNGELGIDLGGDGVTANDDLDVDFFFANHLQNFPILNSVVSANGATLIQGSLNSTASTSFRVEFFANDSCDPSGNGEGQIFLGAIDPVMTDSNGNGVLDINLPITLSGAIFITATATNHAPGENRDTSEFSPCLEAVILVEDCTNSLEDDGDNLVDCEDPDCASNPACAPPLAEICDNAIDDEGDGLTDCADPDCAADPVCAVPAETCDNRQDDDGDGKTDCEDLDCASLFICNIDIAGGGCALTPHAGPAHRKGNPWWVLGSAMGIVFWFRGRISNIYITKP